MKTPEGFVKADVRKYLKKAGVYFFSNTTFGYGGSGQPDITCCVRRLIVPSDVGKPIGCFAGMELKAEGKEPTALQYNRIDEINEAGGFAFWSTDVEDVKAKLKKFGIQ